VSFRAIRPSLTLNTSTPSQTISRPAWAAVISYSLTKRPEPMRTTLALETDGQGAAVQLLDADLGRPVRGVPPDDRQ
jgi:hypothetical protein